MVCCLLIPGYNLESIPILGYLDSFNGVQSRWFGPFNFVVLRMISFTYDFYWRLEQAKLDETVDLDASDEFTVWHLE